MTRKMHAMLALVCAALMMIMPALCSAEEGSAFLFRNGITWESTVEDVIAAETAVVERDSLEYMELLAYDQVTVSNYQAELTYLFMDGKLALVFYYLDEITQDDYQYLTAALSSRYGAPSPADELRQVTLMMAVNTVPVKLHLLTNWDLQDGTVIALIFTDENLASNYGIIYSNPQVLMEHPPVYNTEGL